MTQQSPKKELIARFSRVSEGLRLRGYAEQADALDGVIRSLRVSVPREATVQEVVVRALSATLRQSVTLDGRLVDVLGHLAVSYSVPMYLHPALLVAATLGGYDNPDRGEYQRSATLDALLSTIVEVGGNYQEALYSAAALARAHGLTATADRAAALLYELGTSQSAQEQAERLQNTVLAPRPRTHEGDDLNWVIKLLLTMAAVGSVLAIAGWISAPLGELLGQLDDLLPEDP